MKTEKKNDGVRRGLHGLLVASLIVLGALSACSGDAAEQRPASDEVGYLVFAPEFVGVSSAPQTMGIIDPNFTGKLEFDMGLFICDNNKTYPSHVFHPHAAGYFNMKGHCEANRTSSVDAPTYKWTFTPSNTTVPYTEAGVRLAGGAQVDVYAYTPHTQATVADPTQIPYTASQDDYMYCEPKIGVKSGVVSLKLQHAMTCFSFRIYTTKMEGAILSKIKVTDKTGRNIVKSGVFDATTGEVNNRIYATASDPLYVTFDKALPLNKPDEATFDIIVPPITDYTDRSIEITLMFSNGAEVESLTPVSIMGGSASYEGGRYQFKRGFRYIYELEVDNYVKIKPLGFEEWSTTPDQTVNVEI